MKLNSVTQIALVAAFSAGAVTVQADATAEEVRQLKEYIQQLDQKLKILERKAELDAETAETQRKEIPKLSAGPGGFSFSSADSNFVLKVRGYVQADARYYANEEPANSTFLMRRVRPILEGTVYDKFDYRLMLDFASGLSASSGNNPLVQDAYLNYRPLDEIQLQIGKFKEPVGLERLQSGANLLFVERGFPTQLVPNRDVGIQVHGSLFNRSLDYALGAFNGVTDGSSGDIETVDGDKDLAGRIFAHPFKNTSIEPLQGLGLGVAGTIGDQTGAPRGYSTPGQQRFFSYNSGVALDGVVQRFSPQGYYYWGPFGLFGEYVVSSQNLARGGNKDRLDNSAWQLAASYFLTGERNSFKAVTPQSPFSLGGGGWGAWELTARVGQLTIDDDAFPLYANSVSSRGATSYGVGVNWHLNRNVKLSLNYDQTEFDGGSSAAGAVTAQDERAFFSRVQFSF